jgi:type IX secretion system PorP/SprF family membrane protein
MINSRTYYGLLTSVMVIVGLQHSALAQQQIHFTQYMFNGLVINPAYAGADEALSLTFVQRSQWAGVENAPETQTLSAHTLFGHKRIGLGLNIVNDKIGVHHNINVVTNYAYHLPVGNRSVLSMGLKAGFHNRRSGYSALSSPMVNDPKLVDASRTFFDFGMGVYFRSPRVQLGLSMPELIPARMDLNDTLSVKLSRSAAMLLAKYLYTVNDFIDVEPSVLVKHLSGLPVSYDINANMIYRKVLTLGVSYRSKESIDLILKSQITRQLQIGYSYDHPIGPISRMANGSHELMVQYVFRYLEQKVSSPR